MRHTRRWAALRPNLQHIWHQSVGLFSEALGRCVIVRPHDIDQSWHPINFSKFQKFTRYTHSWLYQFHSEKIWFSEVHIIDYCTSLTNYKVSFLGLNLFRRSFLGRMFSSLKSDIRSRLFGLWGTWKLFWGAILGESGVGGSTEWIWGGRKRSAGLDECAMAMWGQTWSRLSSPCHGRGSLGPKHP